MGNTVSSYAALVEMYMRLYPAAIAKGVSTIKVSYSRWNNRKMHANEFFLIDVLKGRLGFALTIDKVVQTVVLLRLEPILSGLEPRSSWLVMT
jgi:hypothetical protein